MTEPTDTLTGRDFEEALVFAASTICRQALTTALLAGTSISMTMAYGAATSFNALLYVLIAIFAVMGLLSLITFARTHRVRFAAVSTDWRTRNPEDTREEQP